MSRKTREARSAGCAHTENAAPFVLHALTDEEHAEFAAHLRSCAACQQEVAELEVAANALPATAPQLSAPAEVKGRVMATVRQEASLSAPAQAKRTAPGKEAPGWFQWRSALAGAVTAAVLVLVTILVQTGGGSSKPTTRVIDAQVLAAHASATLRISGDHAELDVANMPQPTPNRVYEVWLKRSGGPLPTSALFTVDKSGDATVGVPGSVNGVKVIMVTSEPRGGSRVPTRAPVIIANL